MYEFGARSEKKLATCHGILQNAARCALKLLLIDIAAIYGHRSIAEQKKLYAIGRTVPGDIVTNVDGVNTLSQHNHFPSMAIDLAPWVNGQVSYNIAHVCYMAGIVMAQLVNLCEKTPYKPRWGGNWDMDGEPVTDQLFNDLLHFELRLI
jgi:peptidoglycan L-alanyl-D-glutamate endopeptidase CwlK